MKLNCWTVLAAAVTIGWSGSGLAQPNPVGESASAAGKAGDARSRIAFASTAFDFGRIGMGAVVGHEFIFTNTGTATLEIKDVRPGCGCTTAGEWNRKVEPGRTGVIPLQVNTAGFLNEISKKTVISCNDPDQPDILLEIKGTVWRAFEVKPSLVMFAVSSEAQTNQTKVVRIVSQLEEPVTMSQQESTNAAFRTELKTVKPGKEFELHVTMVTPLEASARTTLKLKTSSAQAPLISLSAQATVLKPVALSPEEITLPPGPLPVARTNWVLVRNNGTNNLALSDAGVDLPGATVRFEEIQPGRLFRVGVQFPDGFQLAPEQQGQVTFKSNHPKYRLIHVPVVHARTPGRGRNDVHIVPISSKRI
ncbi:MAG TPA: DUF1573 domain-containing protein [Haliangiales bacterium]|nr:DUF1573 domain-containing protein [Haliangiales bacterium]